MTTASDARGGVLALGGVAFMVMAVAAAYLWHERGEPETAVAAAAPEKPLKVYFGGCHEVHEGPVCMLSGTATITLWMEDPGYEPVVLVDGVEASRVLTTADGGYQSRVLVHQANRRLTIANSRWTLHLSALTPSAAAQRIRSDRKDHPDDALALAVAELNGLDDHEMAEIMSLRARLEFDLNLKHWQSSVARAIEMHRSVGCLSGMAHDLAFASHRFREQGDIERAKKSLAELKLIAQVDPQSRVAHAYFVAMLENQTGDPRAALSSLDELNRWSERLGDQTYREASIYLSLLILSFLSRTQETHQLLRELANRVEQTESPCERARMLNNLAWFGRRVDLDASIRAATVADTIYEDECPANSLGRALLQLTLGRLLLASESVASLPGVLASLRRYDLLGVDSTFQLALDELEAQWAVRSNHSEKALRLFDSVRVRTGVHYEPRLHWNALVGSAKILLRNAKNEEALAMLQEAERTVDLLVLSIPLGEGRVLFTEELRTSAELLIQVQLERGDIDSAVTVGSASIRRSSSALALSARVSALSDVRREEFISHLNAYRSARDELSGIAQGIWKASYRQRSLLEKRRQVIEAQVDRRLDQMISLADVDWRVPPTESADGVAELLIHPTKGGLYALLRIATRNRWVRLEQNVSNGLRDWLLKTLKQEPNKIDRIDVIVHPSFQFLFVDELLNGASEYPIPVVFSSGLPKQPAVSRGQSALLVGDPDETLPRAQAEIDLVRDALELRNWDVTVLRGAEVTREGLLREVSTGDYRLLHFAGHSSSHGLGGWKSYLKLGGSERVSVADVFALESVPETVVLSSCEGGGSGASPVGIAQALLARGAATVVAATEPVDDGVALEVVRALYRDGNPEYFKERIADLQWRARSQPRRGVSGFHTYVR